MADLKEAVLLRTSHPERCPGAPPPQAGSIRPPRGRGSGFGVQDLGIRFSVFGSRFSGFGFRVGDLGDLRDPSVSRGMIGSALVTPAHAGLEFRVSCLMFGVQGLMFDVWGLGFRT